MAFHQFIRYDFMPAVGQLHFSDGTPQLQVLFQLIRLPCRRHHISRPGCQEDIGSGQVHFFHLCTSVTAVQQYGTEDVQIIVQEEMRRHICTVRVTDEDGLLQVEAVFFFTSQQFVMQLSAFLFKALFIKFHRADPFEKSCPAVLIHVSAET